MFLNLHSAKLALLAFSLVLGAVRLGLAQERGVPVQIIDPKTQKTILTYEVSKALIIANDAYPKMKEPKDRSLPGAKSDLPILKQVLEAQQFEVETAQNLTGAALMGRIRNFLQDNDKEGARLLVWFAGHGFTMMEVGAQMGYIVGVDAAFPDTLNAAEVRSFKKASIPLTEINQLSVNNRIARHVLFIFDSCFSGGLVRGRDDQVPAYIREAMMGYSREYITSGSAKEVVNDTSPLREFFVRGIQGREADRDQDGYVTADELFLYLRNKVIALTTNNPRYKPQHPQYRKANDLQLSVGNFVFKVGKPEDSPPLVEANCERPSIQRIIAPNKPRLKEPLVFGAEIRGTTGTYHWELGDGEVQREKTIQHRYQKAGQYTVQLRVTNGCGSDLQTHTLRLPPLCTGLWCAPWKYILMGFGLVGAGYGGCKGGLCPTTVAKPPFPPQ